jgi:secreted trypsin-like serine protease
MNQILLSLVIFLIGSVAYSGTIDPNTPDSKYVEYGSKFHSVVKLCCFDGKGMSCGSAVIIDPHWIITAAHVVENCHSWSVTVGGEQYKIDKVIIHEDYQTEVFGYNDIALGHVEKEIKLDHYPELYTDSDEVGKVCSMAGLGFTGTFNTGIKTADGKRRAGSNFIDRTERKILICSPSKRNEKITELEYLIGSGDSGGGLFIGNKLAGIHSSVIGYDGKPNSTYTDESCHTRVSLFHDWIKKTLVTIKE